MPGIEKMTVSSHDEQEVGLRRSRLLIATLAAASILLYWVYVDLLRPLPSYTPRYDPEMPYMMNSLAVFKSRPYAYIDHPGTPLEVIGSALLATQKVFLRIPGNELIRFTLENPRTFMTWAHGLLALGSAATVFILVAAGFPVKRRSDLLPAVAAALAFFAVHSPPAFNALAYWSHNSFNFPAGTLLLTAVVLRLRRANDLPRSEIVLFGVLAGVLAAVQLYFATWAIGIGLMLGLNAGLRHRSLWRALGVVVWVAMASAFGFFLATQPVLHRYREFAWWVTGLILHQGKYGQGPRGVTSLGLLTDNLSQLWSQGGAVVLSAAVVTVALVIAAMAIRRRDRDPGPWWWSAVIGCGIQLVLAFALILKHPGVNYLLAVAAILPILSVLAWEALASHGPAGRSTVVGASLAVLFLFAWGAVRSLLQQERTLARMDAAQSELEAVSRDLAADLGRPAETLVRLWGYDAPSACLALRFGNGYADRLFEEEIHRACPRDFEYNIWTREVRLPEGAGRVDEVDGWDLLILPTRHLPAEVEGLRVALTSAETGLSYVLPPEP